MKETKKFPNLLLQALLAMACFLGAQYLLGIAYEMLLLGALGNLPGDRLVAIYTAGTLLITLMGAFPLFCAIMRVKPRDLQTLFQRQEPRTAMREAGQYLAVSLGATSLPVLLQAIFILRDRLDASTLSGSSGVGLLMSAAQFVVVMPVVEEMMFRGVILRHFRRRSAATAVVSSALLFSLGHLNLANALISLPIGFVLGYAALRTGSIRLPLALHMAVNLYGNLLVPNILAHGGLLAAYCILGFALVAVIAAILIVVTTRGRLFAIR